MWTKPGYKPEQPAAPIENGQRLATFPRGANAELRVNLAEYQGSAYVSLRVWERGSDGRLFPVKGKGCSVRLAECAGLAGALLQAIGDEPEDRPADDRPQFIEKRRRPQRRDDGAPPVGRGPLAAGDGGTFDEFK